MVKEWFQLARDFEEPTFSETKIFYNYVFDLGHSINPIQAGRQILRKNYSLALANSATDKVELSTIFKRSFEIREKLIGLSDVSERLEEDGLKAALTSLIRNPQILRAVISAWLAKRKTGKRRSSKSGKLGVNLETADGPQDSTDNPESHREVNETLRDLDRQMMEVQAIAALYNLSDRHLFSEIYLSDVPFVRLVLQPVTVTVNGNEHKIAVGLLIHRTGVAILTFHIEFPQSSTADELIRLKVLSNIAVTKVRIPDALMASQALSVGLVSPQAIKRFFKKQTGTGKQESYEFQTDEGTTLRNVAEWYRVTILGSFFSGNALRLDQFWHQLRSPDWHAYPIYFIAGISPRIRFADEFRELYPRQLAGLLTGFKAWRNLNLSYARMVISADQSLTNNQSFYLGESHTSVMYYDSERTQSSELDWLFGFFQRSGLAEILLIQRWILHVLARKTDELPVNLKTLNRLKRDLLLALGEYFGITVSAGSAEEILAAGQKTLRINDRLEAIKFKLANLEKIIDVEESLKRYRRDLFLRLVIAAGTLLFGISGAAQVITVISTFKTPIWIGRLGVLGHLLENILLLTRAHPHYSTVLLYLMLVVIILPVMFWSVWQKGSRRPIVSVDQSKTAKMPGFSWPAELKVELVENQEREGWSSET
jgi:hypothetical protein